MSNTNNASTSVEPTTPLDLIQREQQENGSLTWTFPLKKFILVPEGDFEKKKSAVREFYEQQNELVKDYQNLMVEHHYQEPHMSDDDASSSVAPPQPLSEQDPSLATPTMIGANSGELEEIELENDASSFRDSKRQLKSRLNKNQDPHAENDKKLSSTTEAIEVDEEVNQRGISPYWLKYEHYCLHGSFWINVCLFGLKLTASVTSMSLSVITSALDSFLDLLSGLILFITNRISKQAKHDRHNYPMGKSRLEPLGFIIFASVMATAALQIVRQGFQDIIQGFIDGSPLIRWDGDPTNNQFLSFGSKRAQRIFYYSGMSVLAFTAIVKGLLWQVCKRCKHSPSVQAYAFDHRNDLLTNSFLLAALLVSKWVWWLDPLVAILLSCYIIYSWIMQSMEHIQKLIGQVAESDFMKKVTYVALNHHKDILKVDTVQSWYLGMNKYVEVDIVLPEDMPLKEAHDIGEQLQKKIEKLDEVERCYVHLDYEYEHAKCDEHIETFY